MSRMALCDGRLKDTKDQCTSDSDNLANYNRDTVCTMLYQTVPVLVTTSEEDGSLKSWIFPSPPVNYDDDSYVDDGGEDVDISGMEVKAEPREEKRPADGDAIMVEAAQPSIPAAPQAMVVKTNASFPLKTPCLNMIFVNGRLISCGKTPDSFIHWNFVSVKLFTSDFEDLHFPGERSNLEEVPDVWRRRARSLGCEIQHCPR